MKKSTNPIVQKALNAKGFSEADARAITELIKSKPWERPEYKAKVKAELDKRVRKVHGNKTVDEWVAALKKMGVWKG